jgi:F0F1-type ATP synthase assembly protein I
MTDERESRTSADSGDSDGASTIASASSYAGLGVQFVLAILLFLYAGRWLDSRLHTRPLFIVIGMFVGAGTGFYVMYRGLMANSGRGDWRRTDRSSRR